ncbi:MAG: DUF3795 domain-containing protein [Firmicutes bacterium]|nr:DUF3795 domain-containing protein [Bacillota bacterium]
MRTNDLETYKKLDNGTYEEFKNTLIDEINALNIEGLPKVTGLNELAGNFVNFAYRFPNGYEIKILDDEAVYLGNRLECEFDKEKCFGVLADNEFILVCTYGKNGADPELVIYKKR